MQWVFFIRIHPSSQKGSKQELLRNHAQAHMQLHLTIPPTKFFFLSNQGRVFPPFFQILCCISASARRFRRLHRWWWDWSHDWGHFILVLSLQYVILVPKNFITKNIAKIAFYLLWRFSSLRIPRLISANKKELFKT